MLKRAEESIAEFPRHLASILDIFRRAWPPQILAQLAWYGLHAALDDNGNQTKFNSSLQQHHVELLQALVLTLPIDDWGDEQPTSEDIGTVAEIIVILSKAFHERRMKAVEEEMNIQDRTVLSLQERVRHHTQIVRNWGYFADVISISGELYEPLDQALRDAFGFSATDLIQTARQLVDLLQERSNTHYKLIRLVLREKKTASLIKAYYRHFQLEGDPEEFFKIFSKEAPRAEVLPFIIGHSSLRFEELMTFQISELAERTGISEEITQQVLNTMSLLPGSLEDQNPEHLFMSNPIWQTPIVVMPDGYFCPIPQAIFSHIHKIIGTLADSKGLKKKREKLRSNFLEKKVAALLHQALPSAKFKHGAKWYVNGDEYETDHLALVDKTLVIVEDKSGALTSSGLRGAPERVRYHINELVINASEQSARFEKLIWQAKAGDSEAANTLAPLEMDFENTEQIIRISVTLDDFSILASAEGDLRAAGWLPDNLILAPTLNVADFQVVSHILDSQAFFLHYFLERERFQRVFDVLADELDFLGFYLDTGFNVGDFEQQEVRLQLTGMSDTVDRYFTCRDEGLILPKPKPKLSPYFAALITAVEKRAFPGWSLIVVDVLRAASAAEQRNIERALLDLKKNVERKWRDEEHNCSLIVVPPECRDTALVFYLFPPELAPRRHEIGQLIASQALTLSNRERCVMISRSTSHWNEPYASIFVVRADLSETLNGVMPPSGDVPPR